MPNGLKLGILTRNDIESEVKQNNLISDFVATSLSACSYDMRIGTIFLNDKIIKAGASAVKQVILQPGEIISVFTLEELSMPPNVTATAFAINGMSSDGLLVLNPGHVDPGFEGPLSVRLINIRATPKAILLRMRIFTVIFEYLPHPTEKPYDKNQPRDERELDFETRDIEQNPRSLYNLIASGKHKPIMNYHEVRSLIAEHWMSRVVFVGTILAAIFAGLTLYVVWYDFSRRAANDHITPSVPNSMAHQELLPAQSPLPTASPH